MKRIYLFAAIALVALVCIIVAGIGIFSPPTSLPGISHASQAPPGAHSESPEATPDTPRKPEIPEGFHTIDSAPPSAIVDTRSTETDESFLISIFPDHPPVEVTFIYRIDPDTGEKELLEDQVIYPGLVSVRLRYQADPTDLLARARQLGARLYRSAKEPGEELLLSLPSPRIGGFGENRMLILNADDQVIRVLPVEVLDPAIRREALEIARKSHTL